MGSRAPSQAPSHQSRLAPRSASAGAGRAVPGCAEEPRLPASPAEARRFLPHLSSAGGGCPQVNKYMAELRDRVCPSLGVPLLPLLSPGRFGGFSALPKSSAAAPLPGSPSLCRSPPVSSLAPLALPPPQAAAPFPSSGAESPPPRHSEQCPSSAPSSSSSSQTPWPYSGPPSHPVALPGSSVGAVAQVVPVAPWLPPCRGGRGTLTGRVCGMGLPARLFLEMEGVFINSRFFRENMVPGGGRAPALGDLSLGVAAEPDCQLLAAPATFAGANCQEGACDAALFPHRLRRRT